MLSKAPYFETQILLVNICSIVATVSLFCKYVNPIINFKGSFFEPAVGSHPNFARMCG